MTALETAMLPTQRQTDVKTLCRTTDVTVKRDSQEKTVRYVLSVSRDDPTM